MTTTETAAQSNSLLSDISDDEWDATIGAGPQMRKALEEALREFHWLHREYGGRAKTLEVMDQIREAITEATHQPTSPRRRRITGKHAHLVDDVKRPG